MDGFTWLAYPATGGVFRCPSPAVEAWRAEGWEPCDPPEEVNPAIADRLALEQQAAAAAEATTKPTKSARRGESSGVSNG